MDQRRHCEERHDDSGNPYSPAHVGDLVGIGLEFGRINYIGIELDASAGRPVHFIGILLAPLDVMCSPG